MAIKIYSAAPNGLESKIIEVEVDLSQGLHFFNIVGLPDNSVKEAKERVASAIKNSGGSSPTKHNQRIIINLAPADIKKEGSLYDLPIAVAYLLASEQINFNPATKMFMGELSLDGNVRPVNGVLPIVNSAREQGFKTAFVPKGNAQEAALIDNIDIIPVESLAQLVAHIEGKIQIPKMPKTEIKPDEYSYDDLDIGQIKGQYNAKRCLEIAAAGGHNILMYGPPGSGKTILAKSLTTILPNMTENEILETTKIYSVAGILKLNKPIITNRPFRSPHHTASMISLVGGGAHPKPGEITLAHRGILFLDELPEFNRSVLEALRQPLENNEITVSRAQGATTFPANFIFVGAMNPCPCGNYQDPKKECVCSTTTITKYQNKISGPLLDRMDLYIEVPRINYEDLAQKNDKKESAGTKERVERAREIQRTRFEKNSQGALTNSDMNLGLIKEYCGLGEKGEELLKNAMQKFQFSARGYFKILRVSRTIADLNKHQNIEPEDIMEAINYRFKNSQ